jgi:hypothetical protein
LTQYNHTGTVEEKQRASTKADAVLTSLQTKTPAEIEAWVNANINNVADVKVMFKRILVLLAVLSRNME